MRESKVPFLYPLVVVVVLNWNGKDNTHECLCSLSNLSYPNYEILVVDNASTDESIEYLRRNFSKIALIENSKNLGFGEGFNVGIREAIKRGSDYVLCLNNDVIVDGHILDEMVQVGELNSNIGGLCPLEYNYFQPDRIICAGGVIGFVRGKLYGYGELDKGQYAKIVTTGLLSGSAMMFKLSALQDVGLFDKNYFYGPEDQDVALRLLKRGYSLVFVPRAKLWHKRRGVTKGKITPLNEYFHVRNHILFVKKNATGPELLFAVLYFGLLDFPLTFFKRLISGKWKHLSAMIKGIIWHFDSELVPSDPQMVELLSKAFRTPIGSRRNDS